MRRFVPDGLAVRADGADLGARDARFCEHGDGCIREPGAEVETKATVLTRRTLCQRRVQPLALLWCVFGRKKGEELRARRLCSSAARRLGGCGRGSETDDGGGDAVERCAGHQPDVDAHGEAFEGRTGGGGRWTMRRITPLPSSSARSASSRDSWRKYITIAVFTMPPAAS